MAKREPSLLKDMMQTHEREILLAFLNEYRWNVTQTAQVLGVHRNSLIIKMRQYGLRRGRS